MPEDYIDEKGVEYIKAAALAIETNRSIDSVTETCRRNNLSRLRTKLKNRVVTVLPPETVKFIRELYAKNDANRDQNGKRMKDRSVEWVVIQCEGCKLITQEKLCKISMDPYYQWNNPEGCWIRKLWEAKLK